MNNQGAWAAWATHPSRPIRRTHWLSLDKLHLCRAYLAFRQMNTAYTSNTICQATANWDSSCVWRTSRGVRRPWCSIGHWVLYVSIQRPTISRACSTSWKCSIHKHSVFRVLKNRSITPLVWGSWTIYGTKKGTIGSPDLIDRIGNNCTVMILSSTWTLGPGFF